MFTIKYSFVTISGACVASGQIEVPGMYVSSCRHDCLARCHWGGRVTVRPGMEQLELNDYNICMCTK